MKYRIEKYECIRGAEPKISNTCDETVDDVEEFRKIVHRLVVCEHVLLTYVELGGTSVIPTDHK
jgi:hypothetical protein